VRRRTVVYVEDNSANFALVRKLLEASGRYEVVGATDGEAGLRLVASTRPHLVLLDLDLPALTGLEVLERLKADPALASIPVVVVSASVMQRERVKSLEAGAIAFLEKPFDIANLRRAVDDACGSAPAP
jgi:two-component system cell cycle response regulator DivK